MPHDLHPAGKASTPVRGRRPRPGRRRGADDLGVDQTCPGALYQPRGDHQLRSRTGGYRTEEDEGRPSGEEQAFAPVYVTQAAAMHTISTRRAARSSPGSMRTWSHRWQAPVSRHGDLFASRALEGSAPAGLNEEILERFAVIL